jgi:hypothetical protein
MPAVRDTAPAHGGPAAVVGGFLTGGVIGVTLSAFVTGLVIEDVPLFVSGLGLPLGYGLLLHVLGLPRRAREAAVVPHVALAKVESLRAGGTETGDVPVDFVLTVVPGYTRPHRVEITHSVNLIALSEHRVGDVLVVEYPPDEPWRARIVPRPTPEWARRAAGAVPESAPESSLVRRPPEGGASGFATLVGLLLGAAAVLVLFRGPLFGPAGAEPPAGPEPSPSFSESSTVTSAAGIATVTVEPGSLSDAGELRRAVDALAEHADVSAVLTVAVQEHRLSVVFAPDGSAVPGFDLRSLPVDRVPALVRKAGSTLDVGAPSTWQVTALRLTGAPVLRVTVTGPGGSASLTDGG